MEILEAFDVTGCAHSAAALAGVDPEQAPSLPPGLPSDRTSASADPQVATRAEPATRPTRQNP